MTPTNKLNLIVGHIGQLTTTQYDPFPNHYPMEDGRTVEVAALKDRIAELTRQLAEMTAARDSFAICARYRGAERDAAQAEVGKLRLRVTDLELLVNRWEDAARDYHREHNTAHAELATLKGTLRTAADNVNVAAMFLRAVNEHADALHDYGSSTTSGRKTRLHQVDAEKWDCVVRAGEELSKVLSQPNAKCEECLYRKEEWRDGGFCYFWKEDRGPCHYFKRLTAPPTPTTGKE